MGKSIITRAVAYAAGTIIGMVIVHGLKKIIIEDYKDQLRTSEDIKKLSNDCKYTILDKDGNVIYEGDITELKNGTTVTMEDLNG